MEKDFKLNDYSNFLNEQLIYKNKPILQEILSPKFLPHGAWPKETNTALIHQVFINLTINTTDNYSQLTVPKHSNFTTLLKEIIAHFVVERAIDIAELEHPKDAFSNNTLNESFTQYKMIYSTSNSDFIHQLQTDLNSISKQKIYSLNLNNPNEEIEDIIEDKNILAHLEYEKTHLDIESEWHNTRIEFLKLLYDVHSQIDKLEQDSEAFSELNDYDFEAAFKAVIEEENTLQNKKISVDHKLSHLIKENKEISESIPDMKETILNNETELDHRYSTFIAKVKKFFRGYTESDRVLEEEIEALTKKVEQLGDIFENNTTEIHNEEINLEDTIAQIQTIKEKRKNIMNDKKQFDSLSDTYDLSLAPTMNLFNQATQDPTVHAPWVTDELEEKREELFLLALKLQKLLLISNVDMIRHLLDQGDVHTKFEVIHLIFPFISTTYESLDHFYKQQPNNYIDYCLIDSQSSTENYDFITHTIYVH